MKQFSWAPLGALALAIAAITPAQAQQAAQKSVAISAIVEHPALDAVRDGVQAALKEAGVKSRVLLQVHDELILEVTTAEKEQVGAMVQKAMMEAFKLDVPLLAAVTFGKNWAEAAE